MTASTGDRPARPDSAVTVNRPGIRAARLYRAVVGTLRWFFHTLAIVVPVFFLATLITYLLGAVSGISPVGALLGEYGTPEQAAQLEEQFGLDQPPLVRYLTWITGVLTGDLGMSWFSNLPAGELLRYRLGVSFSVAGLAMLFALIMGGTLGVVAALNRGGVVDRAVTAVASAMSTLPAFVVGIGLIAVLSVAVPILPSNGYISPTVDFWEWLSLIIMPAFALSLETTAEIARQLRTGLVTAFDSNYVTGAVLRGLSPRRILFNHVLRNASGPTVAVIGLHVPRLIGGAVITETIFGMPGFSRFIAESALKGDVPLVQGALVVAIVIVLVSSLLANAVQSWLQPATRRR